MTPDRKQAARRTIIEAAGRQFRLAGQAGVGIDGIAREVGQTSGAFYAHFASKAAVFASVVAAGLRRLIGGVELARRAGGSGWAADFAARYLSAEHRKRVAEGCLLPAMSPDVARGGDEVRAIFAAELAATAGALAAGCKGRGGEEDARDRAWVILALCAGGVMLSRAMPDGETAERILSACRAAATQAAGRKAR